MKLLLSITQLFTFPQLHLNNAAHPDAANPIEPQSSELRSPTAHAMTESIQQIKAKHHLERRLFW